MDVLCKDKWIQGLVEWYAILQNDVTFCHYFKTSGMQKYLLKYSKIYFCRLSVNLYVRKHYGKSSLQIEVFICTHATFYRHSTSKIHGTRK